MTVSYAQFIIEYPEFSATDNEIMVTAELTRFDGLIEGFADLHDGAVYRRTAVTMSRKMGGLEMAPVPNNSEPNIYEKEWGEFKLLSYRRGQISGGGLT